MATYFLVTRKTSQRATTHCAQTDWLRDFPVFKKAARHPAAYESPRQPNEFSQYFPALSAFLPNLLAY
jgi:hypothetical protein